MRLLCEYMKSVLLDHTTGDCSLCRHWVFSKHALMEDLKVHTEHNFKKYFVKVYCYKFVQESTLSYGMLVVYWSDLLGADLNPGPATVLVG